MNFKNISPSLREFIALLSKRCICSCAYRFSDIMNCNNKDNIKTIRMFLDRIKTSRDITSINYSINYILNFRNKIEHNNNFLNNNTNNKLNLLLLSYINLNRLFRLNSFEIVIESFDFVFSSFQNEDYTIIRNSILDDKLVSEFLSLKKVDINKLRYNNILVNNKAYILLTKGTITEEKCDTSLFTNLYNILNGNVLNIHPRILRERSIVKYIEENETKYLFFIDYGVFYNFHTDEYITDIKNIEHNIVNLMIF